MSPAEARARALCRSPFYRRSLCPSPINGPETCRVEVEGHQDPRPPWRSSVYWATRPAQQPRKQTVLRSVCVCMGHCPSPGGGEEAWLGSALRRREGGRQEEYWVCRVTSTWGLAPTLMLAPVSVHTGKRDRVRRFGANLIHHDPEASAGPGRGHREMRWGEESADGWCLHHWSLGVLGCNRDQTCPITSVLHLSIVPRHRGSSNAHATFEHCTKVFWCCYLLLPSINVVMTGSLERTHCLA